jgi:hypothetical protein
MAKASDNDFPSWLVTEQASKPSAPAAGKQRLYMKTDHKLYHENSGGTETEVGAAPTIVAQAIFSVEGDLSTGGKPLRLYNKTGSSKTISEVFLAVGTAPATQAIIVDIHKDGTTIFTTQSNRPEIAAAANTGTSTTIEAPTWADDSYLTLEIDQIGTGTVGADLTVHVIYS